MAEGGAGGADALLDRWRELHHEVEDAGVRLLAVSKYTSDDAVAELVRAGQQDFAESRPQQLRDRALRFPSVRWHMIGPLQKNKAKYIARHAAAWHSLEDIDTARAVAALVSGRRLPVLVQVNVAGIAHQHGIDPQALPGMLAELAELPQLQPVGLMCMAPRDGDARDCFASLRHLRDRLPGGSLEPADALLPERAAGGRPALCMGMSGDYRIAIAEGADMVRIGSGLFAAASGMQG